MCVRVRNGVIKYLVMIDYVLHATQQISYRCRISLKSRSHITRAGRRGTTRARAWLQHGNQYVYFFHQRVEL